MPRGREGAYRRRYDEAIGREGVIANEYGDMFGAEIARDPREGFRESARGAFEDFRTQFGEDLERVRGQSVGMGRLRTGFGDQDEDELFRDMGRNLNTRLSTMALDAERLGLQRTGMIGNYAESARDRYTGMVGGEYHTARAQRLEDKRDRRRMWGAIGGGLLTAAGTALGGPLGGAAAAAISRRWGGGGN